MRTGAKRCWSDGSASCSACSRGRDRSCPRKGVALHVPVFFPQRAMFGTVQKHGPSRGVRLVRRRLLGNRGKRLFVPGWICVGRSRRLERIVGTGVLARAIQIAAIRQGCAGSCHRDERAKEQENFHASIETDALRAVNPSNPGGDAPGRKQLRNGLLRGSFELRQGLWTED